MQLQADELDDPSYQNVPPVDESGPILHDPVERDYRDGLAILHRLARDRGLVVKQVPRDGNCLFNAILCQLPEGMYNGNADQLRNDVADFLRENPTTPDDTIHYRNFVAPPPANQEHNAFNADMEMRTEEDDEIERIHDPDARAEAHWQKYLRRLRAGAWGDNIAIMGLSEKLKIR